jgi:hypothetical protein
MGISIKTSRTEAVGNTYFVVHAVEETWHGGEDSGPQFSDIVHQLADVPLVETHARPIHVHGALEQRKEAFQTRIHKDRIPDQDS